MKKYLAITILGFALVLSLAACGGSNQPDPATTTEEDDVTQVTQSTEPENKVSQEEDVSDSAEAESQSAYTSINFGEAVNLDFVEFTIDGASTGDTVLPDNPSRVYRYQDDTDGEKYFYIYGTIKNVSGNQYEFARNMYSAMTFDDKYHYSASTTADEGGSFSYLYAYLDPLKSEKFYIIASVPDEMIEQYSTVDVEFGFKENFGDQYGIQAGDCDYLYSVHISK